MDHDQAMGARHAGEIVDAVVKPAEDANGWILVFVNRSGTHLVYRGHTGTEKVYHSLDQVTDLARQIGFHDVRVEEAF